MTDAEMSDDMAAGRGAFDGFSGYMTPAGEDWKRVLGSGTVVLDANVLLNLYRYNQDARDALLSVLKELDTRLWVPNQVMVEFWRNRENALEDPLKQLDQSKIALRGDLDRTSEKLRTWANRVSLDRRESVALEAQLSEALEEVIGAMERVVDSSGLGMEQDTSKDRVVSDLADLLAGKVGAPFSKKEYEDAIVEGKRRIEKQVPPGYMDKKKDSRGDNSEVADYFVWRQIKLEAKRRGGDLLFVTGDAKEDWWRLRHGIAIGPRNELVEELLNEVAVHLYMLKPERLLVLARDHLQVPVSEGSVQNVEMVDAQSEGTEEVVGNLNYIILADLIRLLRAQAPVQEAVIARAVQNGGFVSRDEVYEIGGYEPGRMLKGFTRPVTRISQDLALELGISRFAQDVLIPIYEEMKAGFGWVDGFAVPSILHGSLEKAWSLIEMQDGQG